MDPVLLPTLRAQLPSSATHEKNRRSIRASEEIACTQIMERMAPAPNPTDEQLGSARLETLSGFDEGAAE